MKAIAEMVADLLRRPEKSSPKIPVSRNLGFPRVRCYELLMVDQQLVDGAIISALAASGRSPSSITWLNTWQAKKI